MVKFSDFLEIIGRSYLFGKRRLNFANFTRKERLNFPLVNGYFIDHYNLIGVMGILLFMQ